MAARSSAGFTLIEVLIALLISSILTGVIFQTLRASGRFVQTQDVYQEVQQNTRGALELLTSELRGVTEWGLRQASADRMSIRSPRVWGIVCASTNTASNSVDVAVPALPGVDYTADPIWSRVAARINGNWTPFARVNDVSDGTNSCNGDVLPAGVERRRFSTQSEPPGAPLDVPSLSVGGSYITPQSGDTIYLFDWVTYRVDNRDGQLWIVRQQGSGPDAMVELIAGPVTAPDSPQGRGLEFSYYDAQGNVLGFGSNGQLSIPDETLVRRVKVVVRSRGRGQSGSIVEADTAVVVLRNR